MIRALSDSEAHTPTQAGRVPPRPLGQLVVAFLLAALLPGGATGAVDDANAAAETSMCRKMQRGVASVAFGFLEIPATITRETRENGLVSGLTLGLTEGLNRFVAREVVGVYQVVTAPFRTPDPYPDVLAPEFPWSSFQIAAATDPFAAEERELGWIRGVEIDRRADALVVRFPGDLLFDFGSDRVMASAELRLVGLAETLERYPETQIEVQGYTDSTGPVAFNQELSERRARSVRDFLVDQGLPQDRIATQGFGVSHPIASNDSSEGRRANRRVEVELRK
jgi:putative exosortase-associated protein (TIGR04073 family)